MESVLIFMGIGLLVGAVLMLVLPSVEHHKQLVHTASWVNQRDSPLYSSVMVRAFSQSVLPRLDNWNLLGRKLRHKYEVLGKKESYFEYLAIISLKSLLLVPFIIVAGIVMEEQWLFFSAPISVFLLGALHLSDIHKQYKKRESLLIADLPNLISKMMIALETGTPFERIFTQVSEQCHPLLGGMLKQLLSHSKYVSMSDALQRFARDVNLPIMYDFVSVVQVGLDKGYKTAMGDLENIKNDLKTLRRLSLVEQTKANPAKMNLLYVVLFAHIPIFLLCTAFKMFGVMNSL